MLKVLPVQPTFLSALLQGRKVGILDGTDYSPKEYADKVCEVRITKSEDYVLVANLIGAGEEYYEKLVAALTDNPSGATIFIAI